MLIYLLNRLLSLLNRVSKGDGRPNDLGVRASSFIATSLRDGPKAWADVAVEGAGFGFTEITLRRQRDVVAEKFYADGHWLWRLREGWNRG